MHRLRMHKGVVFGLGVALATFAVGITAADAQSCDRGRRACRCAPHPGYAFVPPPPPGLIPPNPVYGYRPPRGYSGYGASREGYDYPPTGYGRGQPWFKGASYWGPPRAEYGSYPERRSRRVRLDEEDYAPPPYHGYRHAGGWAQNR